MAQAASKPAQKPTQAQKRHSVGAKRNPESEEAILNAAEALLAEKGVAGFSIEAVARAAHAGKPTIYRWWPNRTSLVLAVYQRTKAEIFVVDTGAIATDCIKFTKTLIAHWRDTSAGQIFKLLVAEAQSEPQYADTLRDYSEERLKETARMFQRGIDRGELREGLNTLLAAEMLVSFVKNRLLMGQANMADHELETLVDQLLSGLKR